MGSWGQILDPVYKYKIFNISTAINAPRWYGQWIGSVQNSDTANIAVSKSVGNSYSCSISIPTKILTAALGYNTSWSDTISDSYLLSLPAKYRKKGYHYAWGSFWKVLQVGWLEAFEEVHQEGCGAR